jgi:hypothetical protein
LSQIFEQFCPSWFSYTSKLIAVEVVKIVFLQACQSFLSQSIHASVFPANPANAKASGWWMSPLASKYAVNIAKLKCLQHAPPSAFAKCSTAEYTIAFPP